MRAQKIILDSDEEDEVVIEAMPDTKDSLVLQPSKALTSSCQNEQSPFKPTSANVSKGKRCLALSLRNFADSQDS